MKVPCGVIKDLLPLYQDNVCSQESRALVEEHLESCPHCRTELQAMGQSLADHRATEYLNEAEAIQKLSRRWERGMVKSLLKGIGIGLIVVVSIMMVLYLFMDVQVVTGP